MLIDVAAIPPASVARAAVRLARELSHIGADDIELGGEILPHVSLLIMDVEAGSVGPLKAEMRATSESLPDDLGYGTVSQQAASGRVFWDAVGDGLVDLHERALELGLKYHSRASEELWLKKADRLDETQRLYVKLYGYPYVREYFRPHITLARFREEVDIAGIEVPQGLRGIDGVGLFELDSKYRAIQVL